MSIPRLRKCAAAAGIAPAAVVSTAGAATASEDAVLSQWYQTQYECQYDGNTYAKQGVINNFRCTPDEDSEGWILTGWLG